MADWFKFYENDLDETRLQYAIAKLPEVVAVWVGILSECCRHKSGTVRWGTNEIELFGFSRRLNVSIPKVNAAINLLVEIEYIAREGDMLNVLRWNKKQSEYCQAISRRTPESVPSDSRESRPRGEESRGEENKKQARERVLSSDGNGKLSSANTVKFNKEHERNEARIKELESSVESHRDLEPKDREELAERKARRKVLRSILEITI